ncbi:MAG: hypothetical protein H6698_06525 [Myxococcales bacterium]|nr:hypothetical protein [Myxococcales bacterium]
MSEPNDTSALSEDAELFFANSSGRCRAVYLGLTCAAERDPAVDDEAPVCAAARERLSAAGATLAASADEVAQYYDDPNSGRIVMQPNGQTRVVRIIQDGDPLRFELWRLP